MKKILIIGVGWEQIPLVNQAKKMELYTIVTTWWNSSKISADKVYQVDSRDITELEKIYLLENPDYIIADECDYSMFAVAYLTSKYHLPGPSMRTQMITNNKYLQREYVNKTDIRQPEYRLCWCLEDARNISLEIGYPVIVKPVDNRGSIGISKVVDEQELIQAWYLAVANSHSRMCIIEKYIDGSVVTAEGFFDSENFEFIVASTKEMCKQNKNVAKIVCYPGILNYDLVKSVKWNAEQVAKAIHIDFGFSHMEFIIEDHTKDIYFVEAANRGGGVFISNKILNEITGIDYNKALLELAMGRQVLVKCNQQYCKSAAVYITEFGGNEYFDEAKIQELEECVVLYMNKYTLHSNVEKNASAGRQGAVILSGNDLEQLKRAGAAIEKKFKQDDMEHYYEK